jgi:hypothetical protein
VLGKAAARVLGKVAARVLRKGCGAPFEAWPCCRLRPGLQRASAALGVCGRTANLGRCGASPLRSTEMGATAAETARKHGAVLDSCCTTTVGQDIAAVAAPRGLPGSSDAGLPGPAGSHGAGPAFCRTPVTRVTRSVRFVAAGRESLILNI